MHLPIGFSAALAQGLQEARPVCVVLENGFAPVPAVHQVVNRPGILHSEFSRHAPSLTPTRHLRNSFCTMCGLWQRKCSIFSNVLISRKNNSMLQRWR